MGEVGKRGFDKQRRGLAVEVERLVPEFNVELVDGLGVDESGIVDENVDLEGWCSSGIAKVLFGGLDERRGGRRVEQIGAHGKCLDIVCLGEMGSEIRGGLVRSRCRVVDYNVCPPSGKVCCYCCAET